MTVSPNVRPGAGQTELGADLGAELGAEIDTGDAQRDIILYAACLAASVGERVIRRRDRGPAVMVPRHIMLKLLAAFDRYDPALLPEVRHIRAIAESRNVEGRP